MDLFKKTYFVKRISCLFQLVLTLAAIGSNSQFQNDDEELRPISMKLSDDACVFPSRWDGNWFQSGVATTISINHTSITSKGRCVQAHGDKYIVYSQSEECYRCVVFHEKHLNVLQYKETFCYADTSAISLRSLCRRIPGDAHLYSMFRLDSDPIPCPFQGSFTFTYSRGQGVCHSPVSTIDTCNRPSNIVLSYQACYDVPGTESRVEELECLAQWKEGSSRYMVGLLKYHDPSSYEERFRCFAYEPWTKFGSSEGSYASSYTFRRPTDSASVVSSSRFLDDSQAAADKVIFRVAQSGDATCLGLTPVEGSRTLTLRKALPVQNPCTFPKWLQAHVQWLTLDGRLSYSFTDSELRITNNSIPTGNTEDSSATVVTTAVCIKEHYSGSSDESSLVLRVTSGCQIGYICLRLYKRDHHILELQMSKLGRDLNSVCVGLDAEPGSIPFITLTSPTPEMRECPFIGQFDINDMSSGRGEGSWCHQELKGSLLMGCGGLDTLYINNFCSNSIRALEGFRCNAWWEDTSGDIFVVVSSTHDKGRHCFQIQEKVTDVAPQGLKKKQPYVTTYEDDFGGHDVSNNLKFRKSFTFLKHETNCERTPFGLKTANYHLITVFNTSNIRNCELGNSVSTVQAAVYIVVSSFIINYPTGLCFLNF